MLAWFESVSGYNKLVMKHAGYVILAKDPAGTITGWVEHSFSMGTDATRIRVDRLWEFKPYISSKSTETLADKLKGKSLRQHAWFKMNETVAKINKLHKGKFEFKAFRIGCKTSPVVIDWTETALMRRKGRKAHDKFKWRNPKFKLKEDFVWK